MRRETLPPTEVKRLRVILLAKLGLPANAAPPKVLDRIMERSTPYGDVTGNAPDFDLGEVFEKAGIAPRSTLYYWHGWDEMDTFDRAYLFASIAELWASATPDDVNVFDASLGWLLTIEHTGLVECVTF